MTAIIPQSTWLCNHRHLNPSRQMLPANKLSPIDFQVVNGIKSLPGQRSPGAEHRFRQPRYVFSLLNQLPTFRIPDSTRLSKFKRGNILHSRENPIKKLRHVHHGWIMVIVFFCILVTYGLTMLSFGVFLKPITMEMDWDRGALSGALSLSIVVGGGIGILSRLGEALGAPLSGSIFDITESYRLAFLISIGICALAVILSLVLLKYKDKSGIAKA